MALALNNVARLVGTTLVLAALMAPAVRAAPTTELEFLGQQVIPTGTQFQGTQFGGLSGLAYDRDRGVFYALSDDQVGSPRQPACSPARRSCSSPPPSVTSTAPANHAPHGRSPASSRR